MLETARRRRQRAAILAGVAGIVLLVAIPLYELAVNGVDVLAGNHFASYPLGVAALLALVGAWLGLRSASDLGAHGVDAAILLLVLAFVIAGLGGLAAFFTPSIYNASHDVCMAEGSKAMIGANAVPGVCGTIIPDSDFPSFYPAAGTALIAAVLAIVAVALLVRAHVPREKAG